MRFFLQWLVDYQVAHAMRILNYYAVVWVGLVKDGFQLSLRVECGLLRRFGEKFPFQGLNRR